jgi:uroporphyrinogen-III synthase
MQVFISRALASNSVFQKTLKAKGIGVIGQSLIQFEALSFDFSESETEWIFFYSKKGIEFFFDKIKDSKKLPKIATIGPGSADFLYQNYQIKADFAGSSAPSETARDFLKVARGATVTFVRAKNSVQSIQKLTDGNLHAKDLVVYQNAPKTELEVPRSDILVFTSPLNVQAYFSKYRWQKNQQIISIGQTTAQALSEHNIQGFRVAKTSNEKSLAECCLEYRK